VDGERLVGATKAGRLPNGAGVGMERSPEGPAAWAVIATLACGGFLATFDLNAVAFSLPTLVVEFGVSSSTVAWLIIAYAMAAGGLFIVAGRIADLLGFQRVFRTGCFCLLIGAVIAAVSAGFPVLVVARVIQGAGMALVLSTSPAVLASVFPGSRQDRAIAFYVSSVTTGIIAGPVAGGLVAEALGWRWVFGLIAVLSLALTILAFVTLPRSRPPSDRTPRSRLVAFDYPGALLLLATVAFAVLALELGPARGWSTLPPLLAAGLAGLCLIGFIVRERVTAHTLVDLRLFRERRFLLSSLLCATVMLVYYSVCILVPFYLLVVQEYRQSVAGLFLAGGVLPVVILGPFAMRLRSAEGGYRVRLWGSLAVLAGVLCLLLLDVDGNPVTTVVGLGLTVAGVAVLVPPLQAAALRATPMAERASAAGVLMTMRNLGCIVGAAAAQSLMGRAVAIEAAHIGRPVDGPVVRQTVLDGIHNALLLSLVVAVAIVVMATLLREPAAPGRCEPASDDGDEAETFNDVLRRAMLVSSFAPAPSPMLPLGTSAETCASESSAEAPGAEGRAAAGAAASPVAPASGVPRDATPAQTPEDPKPRPDRSEAESS